MKRFKEFLVEARQRGDLHHFTSIGNMRSILAANTLTTGLDGNISLTRNKNLHKDNTGTAEWRAGTRRRKETEIGNDRGGVAMDVSFVLDGNKLSNKHKIKPHIDQEFAPKTSNPEMEERISGNVPKIKDYIKKLRVHSDISPRELEALKKHGFQIEHDK